MADDESQNEVVPQSCAMSPCECVCCTDYTTPRQPRSLDGSKRKQSYLTKQGESSMKLAKYECSNSHKESVMKLVAKKCDGIEIQTS